MAAVLPSIDALVATRSSAAATHVLRESTDALRVVRALEAVKLCAAAPVVYW